MQGWPLLRSAFSAMTTQNIPASVSITPSEPRDVLLTHRLLGMVCFDRLGDVVAGSNFKFLQGFKQFLLLPEQKDDTLSSAALSSVPDLHPISGEWLLSTATLINNSSRSEVYTPYIFVSISFYKTILSLYRHCRMYTITRSMFKSHIQSAYPGPMRVILCMAKVTLFSSLSWLLWRTKPFIIWCPLPWTKRKQN